MDLKETELLGSDIDNHWYYRSKASAMSQLLSSLSPSVILDVGAGSGFFSKTLLSKTLAKEAWCVDISYSTDKDEIESGKPIRFRRSIDSLDADLVLLMDVLEHVDDDVGLLKDYAKKVPCGTRFLISVPAFQLLWSGHDIFLDHRRRYHLKQTEDVVSRAGLKIINSSYYFGAVFPIAASIRLLTSFLQSGQFKARSQLTRHHPLVNETLATLSALELPFLRFNRLAGLTVFCLAEK